MGTRGLTLPSNALVRAGALFGIPEGTIRVALSRMASAGEVVAVAGSPDSRYRLSGQLLDRSSAQDFRRRPEVLPWQGQWLQAVVSVPRRDAAARTALRKSLGRLGMAEWRTGIWLRPDNLAPPAQRLPGAAGLVASQCTWFRSTLAGRLALPAGGPALSASSAALDTHGARGRGRARGSGLDDRALAGRLWDLAGWAATASSLRLRLAAGSAALETGPVPQALRECFMLAVEATNHIAADPLLPPELLERSWPGSELRADYDAFEESLQRGLRVWFRTGLEPRALREPLPRARARPAT
jgi:phenylacetic acid degradation operon negative regulatory protein